MGKRKIESTLLSTSLRNLYLTQQATMEQVTKDLMGCQAQFANNPMYSMMIRSNDFDELAWKSDYLKLWSFRGTIHTVHPDQIQWLLSARSRHREFHEGWNIDPKIKPVWSLFIREQIEAGMRDRSDLKRACIQQGMDEELVKNVFHGWGGLIREMCDRGMIAYQNTTKKFFVALPKNDFMETERARIAVVEQYFKTFGPATLQDCMYYTAYKLKEIKEYIKKISPLEVYQENNRIYYYYQPLLHEAMIDDVIILTGFDPLILGYKDKSRLMDDSEKSRYVTNTGIIHPGILIKGKLKAKWKKQNDTQIVVTLYQKTGVGIKQEILAKFRKLFRKRNLIVDFIDSFSVL